MQQAPGWAHSMATATPGAGESAVCGGPSECHFGLLFHKETGLIQPLAFLSAPPGLSYPHLAAHFQRRQLPPQPMLPALLLSVRHCFPASLAIAVRALQGMNIIDKTFRLHKSPRDTSGPKILCESKFGDLGNRGLGHQRGSPSEPAGTTHS